LDASGFSRSPWILRSACNKHEDQDDDERDEEVQQHTERGCLPAAGERVSFEQPRRDACRMRIDPGRVPRNPKNTMASIRSRMPTTSVPSSNARAVLNPGAT
jgi:hypothetical protein